MFEDSFSLVVFETRLCGLESRLAYGIFQSGPRCIGDAILARAVLPHSSSHASTLAASLQTRLHSSGDCLTDRRRFFAASLTHRQTSAV